MRSLARGFLVVAVVMGAGLARAETITDEPSGAGVPAFVGAPFVAAPLAPKDVVPHPLLAAQASIHVDAANSDVTDLRGPLGINPEVTSQSFGFLVGTCLNFTFTDAGELLAFCGVEIDGGVGFEATQLDPVTLEKLATYRLLSLTFAEAQSLPLYLGYMATDATGKIITVGPDNIARWVGPGGDGTLAISRTLDLSTTVPLERGRIASLVPDYHGNLYFLVLGDTDDTGVVMRDALLGAVDVTTGAISVRDLPGEVVENGLAIGPDGVFVLSDRAIRGYNLVAGELVEMFATPYARATVKKPGMISWGSGSTPTLVGDHLVAFTDNADSQVHLLVVDRRPSPAGDRVVCDEPVFAPGASENENSVIAANGSIVVQNWYGAPGELIGGSQRGLVPGLVRFDVRPDGSGCDKIWESDALATTATLKLSTASGLLYGGMLDRTIAGVDAYYLGAVDFATGKEAFRIKLGVGDASNIGLSPTYFGPHGEIYQPVRSGVYRVADGPATSDGCASGHGTGWAMILGLGVLWWRTSSRTRSRCRSCAGAGWRAAAARRSRRARRGPGSSAT